MMNRNALLLATITALLSACGAAVDGAYLGTPLQTVRGTLDGALPGVTLERPMLAVIWDTPARGAPSLILETTALEPRLPQDFSIDLFHAPPDSAFNELASGARVAVGLLAGFEDLDGNQRFDPEGGHLTAGTSIAPDRLFAYSNLDFLTVVEGAPQLSDFERTQFVNPDALVSGWNIIHLCAAPPGTTPGVLGEILPATGTPHLETVSPTEVLPVDFGFSRGDPGQTAPAPCPL